MYLNAHFFCLCILTSLQGNLAAPPHQMWRQFSYSLTITLTMCFALTDERVVNTVQMQVEKHLDIGTCSVALGSLSKNSLGL